MYDRMFTTAEMQALVPAADAPILDAEVRLLQVLISRLLALGPALARPRNRRRGAAVRRRQRTTLLQQFAAVCRAVDVLQRLLKTQRALGPDAASELNQLLDEAAKYMDDPSLPSDPPDEDLVIEEYGFTPHLTPPLSPSTTGGRRAHWGRFSKGMVCSSVRWGRQDRPGH